MLRTWKLLAPAALLLALACQPRSSEPLYAAWEEGLTLAFEDPSLAQPQRFSNRLQVRVAKSSLAPGTTQQVQLDLASVWGQASLFLRLQDGGLALVTSDGRTLGQLLPPGFPATPTWTERGIEYRVIGRAAWSGAALLPATADPIGVWVEARLPDGARRRTLFLPNHGEVEIQELRGAEWITVNRLVSRGFTDLPARQHP